MDHRIVRLNEAAEQGNIEAFYDLIQTDVRILEYIDELPFVDTPLHKAASAGGPQHIKFAMEMMRLKPSFAKKPNRNGYSPIHITLQKLKENTQIALEKENTLIALEALEKGNTQIALEKENTRIALEALKKEHTQIAQMVCRLLQVDGDLVRVKGKEGRTPLHDVAAAAATDQQRALLFKFLSDCPNSIEDVTIQNQTALHVALENNNLAAFKRLVRWLRENKSENVREILDRQDEKGDSVLHVAVSNGQTEGVKELLSCGVNLNVRNLEDHTAKDMLQEQTPEHIEIRNMLRYAEALSCLCLPEVITNYYIRSLIDFFYERSGIFRKTVSCVERLQIFRVIILVFERLRRFRKTIVERARISNDDRNALLVVAALLITITYQVVLSPPGGLWQDTKYFGETSTSSNAKFKGRIEHYAGTAIAQETYAPNFEAVATINYITFTLSAIMTFLLLPSGYISALFKMALVQLWVSYYYSLAVICESGLVLRYCFISTGLCFVLVLIAFFGRQFCGVRIKFLNLDWIFCIVYAYIMWWIINFV